MENSSTDAHCGTAYPSNLTEGLSAGVRRRHSENNSRRGQRFVAGAGFSESGRPEKYSVASAQPVQGWPRVMPGL